VSILPASGAVILKQIDEVLKRHDDLRRNSRDEDLSDHGEAATSELLVLMVATIERFAPAGSIYLTSTRSTMKRLGEYNAVNIPYIVGNLRGLRAAYAAGYLATVAELIHAELFADFLEMAQYLMSEGYKDPAAVIAGSVLEEHLRQLAVKESITVESGGRAKKADLLNAELAAAAVYSKLDQKSVIAWLDLRNKAAHGRYNEYAPAQVELLLQSIRDFIVRIPA
jgi:hypothetical protein